MKVQLQIISNKNIIVLIINLMHYSVAPTLIHTAVLIYNLVFCLNKAR